VREGDDTPAYLEKEGATPLRVKRLSGSSGSAAGPEWRLWQLGLQPTNYVLARKKHIVVTPPGENGWLREIQEFLSTQQSEVTSLLQQCEAIE